MSLKVEELSRRFGDKVVLNSLSLEARPGEAYGLLGGNGAGKTTTIRMILGLIHPDSGRISWKGQAFLESDVNFGYLPEERGLYPKSTVREQLTYLGRLSGMNKAALNKAILYWMDRFGVLEYENNRVEELSKGNQQKIQLIATVLHDPDLVILDEPFSGLDPVNSELLKEVIAELIREQKTVIFSSHQMNHVEEFCENLCILKRGNVVLQGNLREIKRSYGRTNVQIRTEQEISEHLRQFNVEVLRHTLDGYQLKVDREETAHLLLQRLVEHRVILQRFEVLEPSLHEIFIEKVGE